MKRIKNIYWFSESKEPRMDRHGGREDSQPGLGPLTDSLQKTQYQTQEDLASILPESVRNLMSCMWLGATWKFWGLSTTTFRMLHPLTINSDQELTLLVILKGWSGEVRVSAVLPKASLVMQWLSPHCSEEMSTASLARLEDSVLVRCGNVGSPGGGYGSATRADTSVRLEFGTKALCSQPVFYVDSKHLEWQLFSKDERWNEHNERLVAVS